MIVSSKLKKSIAVLTAVTLLTTGATTYAAMTKETELTVTTDKEVQDVSTQAATVGALLEEIGYKASNRTVLNVPEDTELTDAMHVVITTKDTVELNLRGVQTEVNTQAATVAEFLEEQNIVLGKHDAVFPATDTNIHDRITISVESFEPLEEVREEKIAYETETRFTEELYEGESRVAQEGQEGVKQISTQSVRHNGIQLPETTKEVVTKEPVTHIIEEGSKVYVEPVEATEAYTEDATEAYTESATEAYTEPVTEAYTEPATESYESNAGGWMNFTATAYDPTVGDTTRMGTPARVGVVAVDPSVIPLGSTVEIEGYGTYSAEDTGGAINGNRIDIFLSSHGEAINFGVRSVRVRILN